MIPCRRIFIPPHELRTRFAPITENIIAEEERLIAEKLQQWRHFGASSQGINVTNAYGRELSFSGVLFDGTIRNIYWSFTGPFIGIAVRKVLNFIMKECEHRNLEPEPYLAEAEWHLGAMAERAYIYMAETDRLLLNAPYVFVTINRPEIPPPKDIESRIDGWKRYIREYSLAVSLRGPGSVTKTQSKAQGESNMKSPTVPSENDGPAEIRPLARRIRAQETEEWISIETASKTSRVPRSTIDGWTKPGRGKGSKREPVLMSRKNEDTNTVLINQRQFAPLAKAWLTKRGIAN